MNSPPQILPVSILSTLCLLSSVQAFAQSMRTPMSCFTKDDARPRLPYTLDLELFRDVIEPEASAVIDVSSASSNFFRLKEPLRVGKIGFGFTGEDIDFFGAFFGHVTLRFETPDDGTGVRPAFLRLTHSEPLQKIFAEELVPLLCFPW